VSVLCLRLLIIFVLLLSSGAIAADKVRSVVAEDLALPHYESMSLPCGIPCMTVVDSVCVWHDLAEREIVAFSRNSGVGRIDVREGEGPYDSNGSIFPLIINGDVFRLDRGYSSKIVSYLDYEPLASVSLDIGYDMMGASAHNDTILATAVVKQLLDEKRLSYTVYMIVYDWNGNIISRGIHSEGELVRPGMGPVNEEAFYIVPRALAGSGMYVVQGRVYETSISAYDYNHKKLWETNIDADVVERPVDEVEYVSSRYKGAIEPSIVQQPICSMGLVGEMIYVLVRTKMDQSPRMVIINRWGEMLDDYVVHEYDTTACLYYIFDKGIMEYRVEDETLSMMQLPVRATGGVK
jgi:hypothetical protein